MIIDEPLPKTTQILEFSVCNSHRIKTKNVHSTTRYEKNCLATSIRTVLQGNFGFYPGSKKSEEHLGQRNKRHQKKRFHLDGLKS